ncbi:hypothetical protein NX862_18885 [Rhodobacter sp. KR11]|uniref:hypothetical protein n=1 Tax=Rhodobacter sp. KR11 TaxID=2974588 RepID=UPI002223DF1D|nr:hypothetical protein [Rhodobacter sp. KR11]MCW1920829.1 hypothetical protein [Rhodobacter sp. KR11]
MTEEPLGRLATFEKTATRFRRLLAAGIGEDRCAVVASKLAHSEDLETAQDRWKAILEEHDRQKRQPNSAFHIFLAGKPPFPAKSGS